MTIMINGSAAQQVDYSDDLECVESDATMKKQAIRKRGTTMLRNGTHTKRVARGHGRDKGSLVEQLKRAVNSDKEIAPRVFSRLLSKSAIVFKIPDVELMDTIKVDADTLAAWKNGNALPLPFRRSTVLSSVLNLACTPSL